MKIIQTSLFGLLLILPFLFIDCTHSVSEPEEKEISEPCKALCGQAFLQGYDDHRAIFIYNRQTGDLTRTDGKGNFILPLPPTGTYSLIATYSLFLPDTVMVEVADSTVKEPPHMSLSMQYLKTRIFSPTTGFSTNDSIRLSVEAINLVGSVVQGPAFIRQDQLWLRDVQDTTKIFNVYDPLRTDPSSTPYKPFESKSFRFAVSVGAYRLYTPPDYNPTRLSRGTYQAWLADIYYPSADDPFIEGGTFAFGDSFGGAKGWVEIKIQ